MRRDKVGTQDVSHELRLPVVDVSLPATLHMHLAGSGVL